MAARFRIGKGVVIVLQRATWSHIAEETELPNQFSSAGGFSGNFWNSYFSASMATEASFAVGASLAAVGAPVILRDTS